MSTIKTALVSTTSAVAAPAASTAAAPSSAATTITSAAAPAVKAAAASAPAAPAHQTVVVVSSVSALLTALKTAQAGDTIQLAKGTYSGLVISGMNFTGKGVTITSQDASHPAVLSGLGVANSSGLTFSHVEMTTVGVSDPYYAFRLQSVQNVTFTNDDIHGNTTVAPGNQTSGFYIKDSNGVSFTNSSFHDMNAAISASAINLVVSNNDFSRLNKGGIELGGGANITISGNSFHDFIESAGTHGDAVQIFTVGATISPSNISITNNTIYRGAGDAAQGIFVQDETGAMPYANLTITGNKVLGETYDSIFVNATVTGTLNVSNNIVTSWVGKDTEAAAALATTFANTNFTGQIIVKGNDSAANVIETGNVAQGYTTGSSIATPAGNIVVGALAQSTNTTGMGSLVTAQAAHAAVVSHASATGNLLAGATGGDLYLADIGVGTAAQKALGASGGTFVGAYGTLTVHQDGTYTYTETKDGLVAGQTYADHFTSTIANGSGIATNSTFDVVVTGAAVGDGGKDSLAGGAIATTLSGFGAGSTLTSGVGKDTFQFDNMSQGTVGAATRIQLFKAGDIIDLSHIDPLFHIVTKFDGHAHELLVQEVSASGNWMVSGDTVGRGVADFQFQVNGTHVMLMADSFHL